MKGPGSRSRNGPYRDPWCRSGSVGRHRRRQITGEDRVPDRMPTGREPPVGHQTVAPENQSQYQHHWTRYCRALDIICGALHNFPRTLATPEGIESERLHLEKAMKRYGQPRETVTDWLRSYAAAMREIGNETRQNTDRYANNRAEKAPRPFRRREQGMARFVRRRSG